MSIETTAYWNWLRLVLFFIEWSFVKFLGFFCWVIHSSVNLLFWYKNSTFFNKLRQLTFKLLFCANQALIGRSLNVKFCGFTILFVNIEHAICMFSNVILKIISLVTLQFSLAIKYVRNFRTWLNSDYIDCFAIFSRGH